MVAFVVAHCERPHGGKNLVAAQRQAVRRVVRKLVIAPLCFQQQCKRGVAADIDPLDRIHLYGDFLAHRFSTDTTWERKRDINNLPPSSRLNPNCWRRRDVRLPTLSIAAKLYLIFALLATVTVGS